MTNEILRELVQRYSPSSGHWVSREECLVDQSGEAAEGGGLPGVLRHRPGHGLRVQGLDVLHAEADRADSQ